MGNGRWWGSSRVRVRALGSTFVLLLAGSVLLGLGSRRYAQKPNAQAGASPIPTASPASRRAKLQVSAIIGQLPLIFEPNQGQADPGVKFLARGAGYSLFLDNAGIVLGLQTGHSAGQTEQFIRMKLVGANAAAVTTGRAPLPGKSNYLIGNDLHKWHSGIPQFAEVRYDRVYPGIDLVFYGNQGHLEYDFKIAPGADPAQAELQFEGASKLKLSSGDLILTGENEGSLRLQAPQVYQRDGDRRVPVAGHFVLRGGNRVGFEIGAYDRSRELVIDPSFFSRHILAAAALRLRPRWPLIPPEIFILSAPRRGRPKILSRSLPPRRSFPRLSP